MSKQNRSADMKASHQFLARLHGVLRVHATEQFFPAFRIHGCEFAHHLVARFPFRVFAQANADREKRGDDPNRDVRCGHEINKELKTVGDKRRKRAPVDDADAERTFF
jgi:hypothetical protein